MGFSSIFWGILFLFDFRINGFDILPDFVGYLLIFHGLGLLLSRKDHFLVARNYTLPLIVLSFFSIYEVQRPLNQMDPFTLLAMLIGLAAMVLNLLVIYHICMGIAELAEEAEKEILKDNANNRWRYFLYFQVFLISSMLIGMLIPPILVVVFVPLFIGTIVVTVLLMGLMKQAEQELV